MSHDQQMGLHGGRLFALAWVGVYPMVTLISWLFGGVLLALPLPIRTLVLSGLTVGYMLFFWMPFLQRVKQACWRGTGGFRLWRLTQSAKQARGGMRPAKTTSGSQARESSSPGKGSLDPSLVSHPGSVASKPGLAVCHHKERKKA